MVKEFTREKKENEITRASFSFQFFFFEL